MTRALYHARELAMNRMEEEADALGADGIVGMRLTVSLGDEPGTPAVGALSRMAGLGAAHGLSASVDADLGTAVAELAAGRRRSSGAH